MDMGVDPARGEDPPLACDHFGAGADDDIDPVLNVGIARLANRRDQPVTDADIGFDDAPVIDDQRIGDDGIDRALRLGALRLAHPVADHLAAAEFHLFAGKREIFFPLHPELGIGEPHPVADGGAIHIGIGRTGNTRHHKSPITSPRNPITRRAPAKDTRVTSRSCPGSKRTAVPAGMSRR